MRILHVVTLFSPDGAYGGPVRVALNQCSALRAEGHDVRVVAGVRGYEQAPTEQDGVPLELFDAHTVIPKTGFSGLSAPGSIRYLLRSRHDFDVIHIHLARDLVVLPLAAIARSRRIPFVVQPHGMIVPSSNRAAPVLDAMAVRKSLRAASSVFHLTENERVGLTEVAGPNLALRQLHNGVPSDEENRPASPDGAAVPDVLFLARLHPRKRPVDFVRAARHILDRGVTATFTLIGPDEGEADAVDRLIDGVHIRRQDALPGGHAPERMRRSEIYVLPSVNEPYPMSVLESMSVGTPVIITEDCGLAEFVRRTGSGLVVEPTVEAIATAIETLLADLAGTRKMGARARAAVRAELSMASVTRTLTDAYREAIADGKVRHG